MSFSKTFIQEKLSGSPGQVVTFNSNNDAIVANLSAVSGKSIVLNVTAPDNVSRIIVSNNIYTYEYNFLYERYNTLGSDEFITEDNDELYVEVDNIHTFYLPMLGDWVVAAVKGGLSTTTSISIEKVGTYNVALSYFNAYVNITYPIGATCTCSNGIDIYYADNTDGNYTFTVNRTGDWTINVYNSEISKSATAVVSVSTMNETIEETVTYLSPVLDDNDWATIRYTVSTGEASSVWHVGDIKEIILNGTVGDTIYTDYSIYAQIIGFNHNTTVESQSKNTISFQIGILKDSNNNNANVNICLLNSAYGTAAGDFALNSSSDNSTGWKNSALRTLLNSTSGNTLINCLPIDLVEMLINVNKYTTEVSETIMSVDKLFIPSNIEVNGGTGTNQVQYNYYQSNSKVKYKNTDLTTAAIWWLRTPYTTGNNTTNFYYISTTGTLSNANANYSYGLSPIFVIGG